MPSDFSLHAMNAIHRGMLKLTGGKVGWHVAGMPALELTTTGRKTGQPRTTMLTSPAKEGDAIVIVASRGGDDDHPSWFLNLRDNPEVAVALGGGPKQRMRARVASDEEHDALWPRIVAQYRNYGGYQKKTDRTIPVVFLEPVEPSS